jgi:hypothetical protein
MLLLACCLIGMHYIAHCADAPEVQAGLTAHDQPILAALRASCQAVTLRKVCLQEIAPQYWIASIPTVRWEEAVKTADQRYPHDPITRTIFLAHYLQRDDPVSRLDEIKKYTAGGSGIIMGCGYFMEYRLVASAEKPKVVASEPGTTTRMILPACNSKVALALGYGRDTLLGPARMNVSDVTVHELHFDRLYCAMDGSLAGFDRSIELPNTKTAYHFGGNTSGTDGTDYYWAELRIDEKVVETIGYTPALVMKERWVRNPAGIGDRYREVYTDGKLVKRIWYQAVKTDKGTEIVIERTETF